jgi:nucleoside-diphosphate-sugar epimerase
MKVLVTGATGFVGRHVVDALLAKGHHVVATARDEQKARGMHWFKQVKFVPFDIQSKREATEQLFDSPDAVIHLAWPGLPNYHALFHIEDNLPAAYSFLKVLVEQGVRQVMVAGTCFEYGQKNGMLSESLAADPNNSYAVAKNSLHQFLVSLSKETPFALQWPRLFYMYGPGQNSRSLISQLDDAIERGDPEFPMSGGEQLRDYLPVEKVAEKMVAILECTEFHGIVNISSGAPVSVRRLVEDRVYLKQSTIALRCGALPYSEHESFAFWGDARRLWELTGD